MAAHSPLRFFTQSLRHQRAIGSIWPSSKVLSRAMVAPIFDENLVHLPEPLRVLEVGAGIGPITQELVERLIPGDRFDVVEFNPDFCAVLRARFGGGLVVPDVHELSVLDWAPPYRYHHVVSGLPLANFPVEMVRRIYDHLFGLLEPGGTLIMFKYILGREVLRTFGTPSDRRRAAALMEIEAELASLEVQKETVALNVPPAQVLVRRRPPSN